MIFYIYIYKFFMKGMIKYSYIRLYDFFFIVILKLYIVCLILLFSKNYIFLGLYDFFLVFFFLSWNEDIEKILDEHGRPWYRNHNWIPSCSHFQYSLH